MIIASIFLVIFIIIFIYKYYFKEFMEVVTIYKSLIKVLDSRDYLVLKLLPDVNNKKFSEEVLALIQDRKLKSKISYDDEIIADAILNNKLKKLYEIINKMKKNELQEEVFKRIIELEKTLKSLRIKYSNAVEKYNLSLTLHPKLFIKVLHMKPYDIYGKKEKVL